MKVNIELNITDCRDCIFRFIDRGYGWRNDRVICNYKKEDRFTDENILWEGSDKFKETPDWCPLNLKEHNQTLKADQK